MDRAKNTGYRLCALVLLLALFIVTYVPEIALAFLETADTRGG
jgi:hypothetical protein